jgi:hypothetical protein
MRLPRTLYSALGPIPVELVDKLPADPEMMTYGRFIGHTRSIELSREIPSAEARIHTLFHEWVHVAMTDSGVTHMLDARLEEAICDAIGGLLAGAALNGNLKLHPLKKAET